MGARQYFPWVDVWFYFPLGITSEGVSAILLLIYLIFCDSFTRPVTATIATT